MNGPRPWSTWLVLATIACGGAQTTQRQNASQATPIASASRTLAPDLAARVDRAEADALAAVQRDDNEAVADHRERARLWRVALEAEVARIGLEREREAADREIETIETARIADEQARDVIERRIKRELAAAIARDEANRVLTEAGGDEARRRGGDPARIESRRQASRALIDRSAAMLAAAVALGADGPSIAAARSAIEMASRKIDGSAASMAAASTAFARTQRALGHARGTRPGPDHHERASLLEALALQGWSAELLDEGVVVWLPDLIGAGRAALRPGETGLLASLGALLAGHPHGPIQLQALVTATVSKAAAGRRAQLIKVALGDTGSDRIEIVTGVSTGDQQTQTLARVVLPAYGCHALANDAAQCSPESTGDATGAPTSP